MTEATRQQECLNTLKTFNNTIVTIRLYPPHAPQIANAIERGYKAIKQFLREYGDFSIGLKGNEHELCGDVLDPQIVQSISNLIVFRHLSLLESERLILTAKLDRADFKKLLQVFSAKVDQIKKEDGGQAYIGKLRLQQYFPEADDEISPGGSVEDQPEEQTPEELKVNRVYADILLGRDSQAASVRDLRKLLHVPQEGAPVVAATILGVLEGMVQKKFFVTSAALEKILTNCSMLFSNEGLTPLFAEIARLLLQRTEGRACTLLMSQDFDGEAGQSLSSELQRQISVERFGGVIEDLRDVTARLQRMQNPDVKQLNFVTVATERLLDSPRGKQFLGLEKAKTLMASGEKVRKAKRVEAGIKSLLQGSEEVLQNEEINAHLPTVIQKMLKEGMEREVKALLNLVTDYYLKGLQENRETVIRSLAQIAENLVTLKRADLLGSIAEPLIHWLRSSESGDVVYEKVCQSLYWLMGWSWQNEKFKAGDTILSLMYQIRSGTVERPSPVRAIIGRTQDKGIDRDLMRRLLQQCLAEPTNEVVSRRLILQGPIVTRFLVESLIEADEIADRLKIIDLLTYGEQFLPTILVEKVVEPMPWYGKRNLLKLLGDTGSEEHLEVVFPFLQHEDLRVQREAFSCLYRMSGRKRRQVLLKALDQSGESLKLQVIRALRPMGDEDVAEALEQVINEQKFFSDENRDDLLISCCATLARCPHRQAERILHSFSNLRGDKTTRKVSSKVWQAVQESLDQIHEAQQDDKQLKLRAEQLRKSLISRGAAGAHQEGEPRLITGLPEEKKIRDLVGAGELNQARVHLMELLTRSARQRRFTQAEQLRDWLIEIDPMALSDIIKAAEIIDEEKQSSVDKGHLAVWGGLLDHLSTEEFAAFYHALEHRKYRDDDVIMKKGIIQDTMFFINSGRVKLFYRDKDKELLAGVLDEGKILGMESFFTPSVWTISAAALGPVEASSLSFDKVKELAVSYPGIESKLRKFCMRFENVEEVFQKTDNDRRRYTRHQTPSFDLSVSILGESKVNLVNASGSLVDISQGGGSFTMRIARSENARLLLGRQLRLAIADEGLQGRDLDFTGVVVAVKPYHGGEYEYAIHVEFDSVIESDEMEQLMALL